MIISNHFDKLDLHDAIIRNIVRSEGRISIFLTGAHLDISPPGAMNSEWVTINGTLVVFGVKSEAAYTWKGTKDKHPHACPSHPIDEIMHASFDDSCLHLDGYKNRLPWHDWYIEADGFEFDTTARTTASR